MVAGLNKTLNSVLAASFSEIGQEALARALRAAKAEAAGQSGRGAAGQDATFSPRTGYDSRPRFFRDYAQAPNDLRPSEELALFGLPTAALGKAPASATNTEEVEFVEGEDGVFYAQTKTSSANIESPYMAASAGASPNPRATAAIAYQRNMALLTNPELSTYTFAA
jgi:hypothetical protein